MKKIFFFIAGILMSLLSSAQDKNELGKYVGDLQIPSTLYYPKVQSLKELKGKIVLLDFWSSRCLSCFHTFPEMSALQSKFKDDVVHFYVTKQPRKEVEDFFARRPEFLKYNLRFITDAGSLVERFPYLSLPYFVWIGKDGKVKALTNGKQVNEENIRKLLQADTIALPIKRSFKDLDVDAPIFKHEAFESELVQSFILTGPIDGLPLSRGIRRDPTWLRRAYAFNCSLSQLYSFAYSTEIKMQPIDLERLVRIQLKDSTRFFESEGGTVVPKAFCFEQILRTDTIQMEKRAVLRKVQRELDHQFNLKSGVQTVKTDCYIVSKGKRFIPSSAPKKGLDIGEHSIRLTAQDPQTLAAYIKEQFPSSLPLLVEGFSDNVLIDIRLNKYTNVEALRKDLASVGLEVRIEPREVQMLVVSD